MLITALLLRVYKGTRQVVDETRYIADATAKLRGYLSTCGYSSIIDVCNVKCMIIV